MSNHVTQTPSELQAQKPKLHLPLFFISVFFTAGLAILFALNPEKSNATIKLIKNTLMNYLGSAFLFFGLFTVGCVLFLCFSRIGRIKFGGESTKPEYSTLSWLAMVFTGGCGSSMIYWASLEWVFYYKGGVGNTPLGLTNGTWENAEWASTYGLFHSGITPWAFYALVAICVAYLYYVRRVNVLRVSEICRPILGKQTDGIIGTLLDYSYIFALLAGGATAVTFISEMISGFLNLTMHIEVNKTTQILVVVLFAIATATIVAFDLKKGLKKLSNFNLYLLYGMLFLCFFISGAAQFILDTTTTALGLLFNNFFRISLWTDSINKSGFPQGWTIFYWAWWLIYAPTMGIFLAKISKGRTIRQTGLVILGAGTIGCWLLYIVFGNYGLYLDLNGIYSAADDLFINKSPRGVVLAKIFSFLPMQSIVIPLMIILILVFSITSLVAGAYSLAASTTKNLSQDQNPHILNRIFWGFMKPSLTIGLIFLGSLTAVKNSAIIASVPCLILMILMILSTFKMLHQDGFFKHKKLILEDKEIKEID